MNRIAHRRTEIYDYFHGNVACQMYFYDPAHGEEYAAYYNSMYLLQDSTEGLSQHRDVGFPEDPLRAYIEFWGVMQAVTIQQDAIREIHKVVTGNSLDTGGLSSWSDLRILRNTCAGHPVRRDRGRDSQFVRSFMGRSFGDYESLTYERWERGVGRTHPQVNLGSLLDKYEVEAELKLIDVVTTMRIRWP